MYSRCCGFDSSFWHSPSNLSRPCSSQFPFLFISVPPLNVLIFFFFLQFLSFISKCFTGITLVSHCQSLLSHIASLTLCVYVLNHNPVSNGVYWERYQTWPLGLILWPSYSHEKQGFNPICLTAFQILLWKILDFLLDTNEQCSDLHNTYSTGHVNINKSK